MTNRPAPRKFGFETRMVHAGHVPDAHTGARAVPIYQTTSYVFDSADHAADLFELKQYGKHLHAHQQPDHRRLRGAARLARGRDRRGGDVQRHGGAVRHLHDADVAGR